MTSSEIRQSFLDFFREKQHAIVKSGSLLPDSPNLLFTNAGMNQFVPIFLEQQKAPWSPPRVADTQKCIRAGGKHNDLEDVGLDTYHHTFFEMLGNWSFGDYFKKEAIEWAWELVVDRWKLPAQRLYATVYLPGPNEPSEFDQEAHDHWARLFVKAGLDPAIHIVNGNKKDNFWMMGDTGPCGPCSELHIDLTPDGNTKGSLVNAGDPRCIEIWNLVFIQFNADADGTFSPLPQRHVDTGMGFERVTAMIQGTKDFSDFSRLISNYETDVFRPIFDELEKLSGKRYASTLPQPGVTAGSEQEKIDVAFRVIADHIRTLSFAIADGIVPSNEGRGYVLRRILRRAVRYGRTIGFHEPFFYKLTDVLVRTMGHIFPEVVAKQQLVSETISREERAFSNTLDRGIELFEDKVREIEELRRSSAKEIDEGGEIRGSGFVLSRDRRLLTGDFPFQLYDTYGFPLDLTELMARERGLAVDVAGFEELMEEQRNRARKAQKKQAITLEEEKLAAAPTNFLGYDFLETEAMVESVLEGSEPNEFNIVLDRTPCYAEMGGQVGDHGLLHVPGHDRTEVGRLTISDTQKRGNVVVHISKLGEGRPPEPGEAVRLSVDATRRKPVERHHTVTHLLHWALHQIVSPDAAQKGSYVGPDKLTFDFSSSALTSEQKRNVENLVNQKVLEDAPVTWTEIPYAEAKKRSDIQQFFGDKYGETVRVVQIGGKSGALNGYSMELCGGTHVRATGEVGPFRILKEEAIAAGIRRIEAVAGDAARDWAKQEAQRQQERFEALARKKEGIAPLPPFSPETETSALLKQIDSRLAYLEKLDSEVHQWEKQQSKASEADLKNRAEIIAKELAAANAGKKSCVAEMPNADGKLLQAIVDALKSKIVGPIFLAGASDGRVALVASVPKELTSQYQANKLIQEVAPIVGGKGGGRPENAQGAGKDATKINEALARARELILA
ncbi:MAG TPA: alanine--tRNA ligase [Chthoniobacterales bacterium]|nr:alanine--tRNA ligase [Chthoniobacterales bacterium]